jgi:hypothetical protein
MRPLNQTGQCDQPAHFVSNHCTEPSGLPFYRPGSSATWYADSSRSWDLYIPIQEDELHQRAEAAYGDLVADVKQYDAMPEEAAVAQLETEAKPLLKQRREAARGLEEGLAAFLKSQVRLATCLENERGIQSLDFGLGLANWHKKAVLLEEARPSAF